MNKMDQDKNHVTSQSSSVYTVRKDRNHRGSSQGDPVGERGLSSPPVIGGFVLRMGGKIEERLTNEASLLAEEKSFCDEPRGVGVREPSSSWDHRGDCAGKSLDKKRALAVRPGRHKDGIQRRQIVSCIEKASQERGLTVRRSASLLGVSAASYYRYKRQPEPCPRRSRSRPCELLNWEKQVVAQAAIAHPLVGYKRLTYMLQNDLRIGIRAHQTYSILAEFNLIYRRIPAISKELRRPAEPWAPNQVWHMDIMYVKLLGRWYYLIDIIDGYSRYLVHWTLAPTLESQAVTMTVQEALEQFDLKYRPAIVHDSGSQFMSKEWRTLMDHHGLPNIRTRVAHPESNGRIERLHRTHREEALEGASGWTCERAVQKLSRWVDYYNRDRPHLSLKGLPPVVYHFGDPEAAMEQREEFIKEQERVRKQAQSQSHIMEEPSFK